MPPGLPPSVERIRVSPPPLVAIGGSAGGIRVLQAVLERLPADLPATVAVVIHVHRDAPAALAGVLDRRSALPVTNAVDGAPLRPGHVVVAPPDAHLLVRPDGTAALDRGPRENGHRPAVDVLFRSAAIALADRVVGVVLSGALDDGTAGLLAVHRHGGVSIVQDPIDALYDGMPSSALQHVPDAIALPATAIADGIIDAVRGLPAGEAAPPAPLREVDDGVRRYRCRTGHAWSADSLADQQDDAVEDALWAAVRVLEERADLCRSLERRSRTAGRLQSATRFGLRADEAAHQGTLLRQLLAQRTPEPA